MSEFKQAQIQVKREFHHTEMLQQHMNKKELTCDPAEWGDQ